MEHSPDERIAEGLKLAIALTGVTLLAEVAGGIWTNSLALLSDAAHVFLDIFSLVLSLAAVKLASLPATDRHSFGWHRAEVFASFINGVTVLLIALVIFHEAWQRFSLPQEVKSLPLLIIATAGLVANLLSAAALHDRSHNDLNVRSAFLHVAGDAGASIGVIIGGAIMYFTHWYLPDALISVGIGIIIFIGAGRVLRESVHILMEGVPGGMDIAEIADTIRNIEGVRDLHHLNVWAICSRIPALSVHLEIEPAQKDWTSTILNEVQHVLMEKYKISHTTLQVECLNCIDRSVIKDFCHY